jgi:hypothetical protein
MFGAANPEKPDIFAFPFGFGWGGIRTRLLLPVTPTTIL